MEQGREVFAVPGSIRNPLSRGCHALIRDGARLVETAQDVLAELGPRLRGILAEPAVGPPAPEVDPHMAGLEPEYQTLLDAMGFDPVAPDELVRLTGTPVEELSSMLLLLELEGHVSSCAGGRYSRLR
jgi:DNA processing protein